MPSEREVAMKRHPSSGVAVLEAEATVDKPYKAFMNALEDFSMTVSLYGPASSEAELARARVRQFREAAADTWRTRLAA
jgi:hypothetical protein